MSKRIHYSCEGRIEKAVPGDHRLSSLGKPCDTKWRSSGQIFLYNPHTHDGFLYDYMGHDTRTKRGPEVIKLFHAQLNWARNFNCSKKLNKEVSCLSLSDVLFIMLINVKMPNDCLYFNIYEQDKFRAQLSWTWNKFYNLGACLRCLQTLKEQTRISLSLFSY